MKVIVLFLCVILSFNICFSNEWCCGTWSARSWGAIRILPDGFAVDTNPNGELEDLGRWQYFESKNSVIIVWLESSRVEIIENQNGKFYHQMSYSFGIGSEIEEIKKTGE